MNRDPFSLDAWLPAAPAWQRPLLAAAEGLLGLRQLGRAYAPLAPRALDAEAFAAAGLRALGVEAPRLPQAEAELRSLRGPLLVLANHPFGAVEALWLMGFLGRAGRDYRLLANRLLWALPELRPRLLGVDVLGAGSGARGRNAAPLRQASAWLGLGGVLALFPAGEVAALRWRGLRVEEGAWSGHAARLALRHNATVLPVHFSGRNGALFQAAGLLHPRLRTLLLAREAGRPGRKLEVAVGTPLTPQDLRALAPAASLAAALRAHTLDLVPARARPAAPAAAPLDPDPPSDQLATEVERLLDLGRGLAQEGPFQVLWFRRDEAPALMRAVAVGRERSFRDAGEGTLRSRDEDRFDGHYAQIVLWDARARAVAGGYRAAPAEALWPRGGPPAFYSATLFSLDERLRPDFAGALELGRSYVAAPWQRQTLPLLLLWRGVGAYALRVAGCVRLFGCVSISPDFSGPTQRLLRRFLGLHQVAQPRRGWVRPRHGVPDAADAPGPGPTDLRGLERWVGIFEQGRRALPPLLKHYVLMGAQVLAFNRDPDFNQTIDALMLLDLRAAPPRLLKRTLAPEDWGRLAALRQTATETDPAPD